MVKQLGFILDTDRCLGCGACIKSCQISNNLPKPLKLRQIRKIEEANKGYIQKYFLSTSCNHCANPECLRVCPSGAYFKRRNGIVVHNADKCTGCKSCVGACPFRAPQLNEITQKAIKCQLCYDRIDHGKSPYCVQACLTGALQLKELQQVEDNKLLRLTAPTPSLRLTQPSVFYKQPRYTKLK